MQARSTSCTDSFTLNGTICLQTECVRHHGFPSKAQKCVVRQGQAPRSTALALGRREPTGYVAGLPEEGLLTLIRTGSRRLPLRPTSSTLRYRRPIPFFQLQATAQSLILDREGSGKPRALLLSALRKHSAACLPSLTDKLRDLSAQLPSLLPKPETGLPWGRRQES